MRGRATMSTLEKSSIPPARARAPNEKDVVALSSRKSPLAGMGLGQKIATIALAALAVIALLAVLTGRGGGGGSSSSPSSKFSPVTYSDGPSSSGEKSGGEKSGGAGRASSSAPASGDGDAADVVPVAQLPAQARATLKLIDAGGPFPYSRDGIVFANREGRLPKHPRGWYHEYTVETPGESDRGARRLIQGKDGTIYYTGDHYESFRRVQR